MKISSNRTIPRSITERVEKLTWKEIFFAKLKQDGYS